MAHKTGFTKAARRLVGWAGVVAATLCSTPAATRAQQPAPTVFDTNLAVRTVVSGLNQPIGIAFLGPESYFIIEKASGRVKWVRPVGGVQTSTDVLDLAVNSASERGLLSIALHPNFPANPGVYLFWTESSTGADSTVLAEVGNAASPYPPGTPNPYGSRIDRFVWNGSALTFDHNLIVLRSFQADPNQPLRGNHNGGVIRFGVENGSPKLYVVLGDQGRRGQLQNLELGPPPGPDHLEFSRRRSVRWAGARCRAPRRRGAPAQRRRKRAAGQPVLRSRRRADRRPVRSLSARPCRRSMRTASATASALPSIRDRRASGSRRTATTRSASSIAWSPAATAAGCR